jgi:hypothetical protein
MINMSAFIFVFGLQFINGWNMNSKHVIKREKIFYKDLDKWDCLFKTGNRFLFLNHNKKMYLKVFKILLQSIKLRCFGWVFFQNLQIVRNNVVSMRWSNFMYHQFFYRKSIYSTKFFTILAITTWYIVHGIGIYPRNNIIQDIPENYNKIYFF